MRHQGSGRSGATFAQRDPCRQFESSTETEFGRLTSCCSRRCGDFRRHGRSRSFSNARCRIRIANLLSQNVSRCGNEKGINNHEIRKWIAAACLCVPMLSHAVAVSDVAPDFTLKSVDGSNTRLKEFRGQVVLINFWASWCGPCRQEMPLLERIDERYKDAGFTVLGVNVEGKAGPAKDVATKAGVSFPVLVDERPESQRTLRSRIDAEQRRRRSRWRRSLCAPGLQAGRRGEVPGSRQEADQRQVDRPAGRELDECKGSHC